MIGVTVDPGASGVSIAGCEVWKPELLSPAAAAPPRAKVAITAATATSTSLCGFRICVSSPRFQNHRRTYTRVLSEAIEYRLDRQLDWSIPA
jgi:hypothetical protein